MWENAISKRDGKVKFLALVVCDVCTPQQINRMSAPMKPVNQKIHQKYQSHPSQRTRRIYRQQSDMTLQEALSCRHSNQITKNIAGINKGKRCTDINNIEF